MRTGKHLRQAALTAVPLRNVLRTHSRGAIEIAFDDKNSHIVTEGITAKICRGVIDIGHEVLGGERRIAEHCRGKAFHAEFFAKLILGFESRFWRKQGTTGLFFTDLPIQSGWDSGWMQPTKAENAIDAARRIRCPVLGIYGKRDTGIPVADAEALRGVLPEGSEVAFYEAGHAFLNDTRPQMYVADQATLAWAKIAGFLRRHLG